ncbi:MAG TPA: tRNA (adenine-N(1))-methyltransferase, partial [Pseudomonas sp.]|nr:tRNA (adenine-N(1))-methyltransferase [Pseudomonas sp.]
DADQSRLRGDELLVLQPNGGGHPLRSWLMAHGYRIVAEEVLRENRFDYEIVVAERDEPVVYSAEELYFGPCLMRERSEAFLGKWRRLLKLKQKTLAGLGKATKGVPQDKVEELTRQIHWIETLLG